MTYIYVAVAAMSALDAVVIWVCVKRHKQLDTSWVPENKATENRTPITRVKTSRPGR
jgi:hypothetical protein